MRNTRFRSFLKSQLKIDTIPKPVGLGSRGWCESTGCSAFVRYISGNLFGTCSVV
jgi:hypothetical protein